MNKPTGLHIPDTSKKDRKAEFVRWMGPLLDVLREPGDTSTPQEASDLIAKRCGVPDAKKEELTASGTARFHNQVCWTRQYLVWEGLVSSAKRGIWALTETGKKVRLTEEQGREIFKKWAAIHTQRRKARGKTTASRVELHQEAATKLFEPGCDDVLTDLNDTPPEEEKLTL